MIRCLAPELLRGKRVAMSDCLLTSATPGSLVAAMYADIKVGGVESWSLRMLRDASKRGLRAVAALLREPNSADASIQEMPDGVTRFDVRMFSWRAFQAALLCCPPGLAPACIIPNYSLELYALCAWWSMEERPQEIRTIGMCHTDDPWWYWLLSCYEPIIHRFVAVSEECAHGLGRMIPHRAADIVTRPYGIDLPPAAERTYSGGGEPLQLLYAGRMIERQKRISDLLRLSEILVKRSVDFQLRVVGDGPQKATFVRRAGRLAPEVRGRLRVEPGVHHSAMPALLQSADVAVLVSAFEGTSLFMLEAMANGTVPVVTDVSGTRELIRSGITGWRVPVGDLEAMADALNVLALDRAKLAGLGQAARRAVEDYTQEAYSEWFFRLLDEVWNEPPRRWPVGRRVLPFSRELSSRLFDYLPGWYAGLKTVREDIFRRFGI